MFEQVPVCNLCEAKGCDTKLFGVDLDGEKLVSLDKTEIHLCKFCAKKLSMALRGLEKYAPE